MEGRNILTREGLKVEKEEMQRKEAVKDEGVTRVMDDAEESNLLLSGVRYKTCLKLYHPSQYLQCYIIRRSWQVSST